MVGRESGTWGGTPDKPALFFADAAEFRAWLEENYDTATELWMGLRKKHVTPRGLTWQDAVPEALCFGWIDSTAQRIDDDALRQRWTPRKSSSVWSLVNVALVERLTAEGRMAPAGVAAFDKRKPERTGVYSHEAGLGLDDTQRAQLLAVPAAAAFWELAPPRYRKVAEHWVASAKQQQTRERRLAELIAASATGERIKSQRYGVVPGWVARAAAAARDAQ